MLNIHKSVWLTLGCFGVFLFAINCLFPTQSDDLGAGFGGLSGAISMYMNWNGRFGELLRTAFIGALAPTLFFKIVNTITGIVFLLAWFVMIYARLPRSFNDSVVLTLSILCLLIFSSFGSIFVWAAGCLNYLWAYCIVLLVCLPYRFFWNSYNTYNYPPPPSDCNATQIIKLVVFCIASFCAGMSNEITGVVVICIHFCFLFYAIFIKKIKLPFWYIAGILCFLLGFLALYLSPGHAKRAELFIKLKLEYYSISDFLNMGLYEKLNRINHVMKSTGTTFISFIALLLCFIYERFKQKKLSSVAIILVLGIIYAVIFSMQALNFIHHLIGVLLFIAILFYISYVYKRENIDLSRLYYYAFLLFIVCHISLLLTLQVNIPARARLFVVLYGIIGLLLACKIISILFPNIYYRFQNGILALCFIYGCFVLSAFIDMHIKWDNMVAYIEEQKSKGIEDIVVSSKYFHSFYKRYGDWQNPNDNPDAWPNPEYAKYFGVKTFEVKD